jgi:hypothetical protein
MEDVETHILQYEIADKPTGTMYFMSVQNSFRVSALLQNLTQLTLQILEEFGEAKGVPMLSLMTDVLLV